LETIAAVDRFVATRLERNFRDAATLAARCTEHFALGTAAAAAATRATSATRSAAAGSFTRRATIGATIGLICKALHSKKLLFAGRKRKLARTIDAVQVFILIHW
jgi:hypothetical protein